MVTHRELWRADGILTRQAETESQRSRVPRIELIGKEECMHLIRLRMRGCDAIAIYTAITVTTCFVSRVAPQQEPEH